MFKICSCVISDPVSVRSDFFTNIEGNPWNDRELLRSEMPVMRGLWTEEENVNRGVKLALKNRLT